MYELIPDSISDIPEPQKHYRLHSCHVCFPDDICLYAAINYNYTGSRSYIKIIMYY